MNSTIMNFIFSTQRLMIFLMRCFHLACCHRCLRSSSNVKLYLLKQFNKLKKQMQKSTQKRANPFVEKYGFTVDRIIRSNVQNPNQVIPRTLLDYYAILSQHMHMTSEDDRTQDLDFQLDSSVEICSFIELHEE